MEVALKFIPCWQEGLVDSTALGAVVRSITNKSYLRVNLLDFQLSLYFSLFLDPLYITNTFNLNDLEKIYWHQ